MVWIILSIFPCIPEASILYHRNGYSTLSNAFSKSTKAQYVSNFSSFLLRITVVSAYKWSKHDRNRRNPFCSSAYILFVSRKSVSLLFSMELNTLAIVDIKLIPRWLSGNKGSFPFFSMGRIIALYQVLGIIFVSKHFWYSLCNSHVSISNVLVIISMMILLCCFNYRRLDHPCLKPPWGRYQMETFSALLAICAGNSPVPGEFPAQRPVTRSFGVFFDLRLNKRLSKQSWGWWFETPSCPLWRHRDAMLPQPLHCTLCHQLDIRSFGVWLIA